MSNHTCNNQCPEHCNQGFPFEVGDEIETRTNRYRIDALLDKDVVIYSHQTRNRMVERADAIWFEKAVKVGPKPKFPKIRMDRPRWLGKDGRVYFTRPSTSYNNIIAKLYLDDPNLPWRHPDTDELIEWDDG